MVVRHAHHDGRRGLGHPLLLPLQTLLQKGDRKTGGVPSVEGFSNINFAEIGSKSLKDCFTLKKV
jgi:hypothetical protein